LLLGKRRFVTRARFRNELQLKKIAKKLVKAIFGPPLDLIVGLSISILQRTPSLSMYLIRKLVSRGQGWEFLAQIPSSFFYSKTPKVLDTKKSRNVNWARSVVRLDPTSLEAQQMTRVKIFIALPKHGKSLRSLLRSIKKFNGGSDYEIVLLAKDIPIEISRLVKEFSKALKISVDSDFEPGVNQGPILNRGLQHDGDLFVFCDSDVVFRAGFVSSLLKSFTDSSVGIVGGRNWLRTKSFLPKFVSQVGSSFEWEPRLASLRPVAIQDANNSSPNLTLLETWAPSGGFLAIRRDDFIELGGFSQDLESSYLEQELSLRCIRDLNKKVVVDTGINIYSQADQLDRWRDEGIAWPAEVRNLTVFTESVGAFVTSNFLANKFSSEHAKLDFVPSIGFYTTSLPEEDLGHGDPLVASSLGKWLNREFGWEYSFIPMRDWESATTDFDAVVAMRPHCKMSSYPISNNSLKIAWMRNALDEWVDAIHEQSFDVTFVSSITGKKYLDRKCRRPSEVLRLALDSDLITGNSPEFSRDLDVLVTANYWEIPRDIHDWEPATDQINVKVFGKGWDSSSAPAELKKRWFGYLPHRKLSELYPTSRLVIDDSTGASKPWGLLNMRIFEALGGGALVLSNDSLGLSEIFGDLAPVWQEAAEISVLVDKYLIDEKKRESLSSKMRDLILTNHTYMNRAHELQEALFAHLSSSSFSFDWGVASGPEQQYSNVLTQEMASTRIGDKDDRASLEQVLPSVSVIIAVHNTVSHLEEAVDSALASVGVDVKVIIVDDASSDGSAAIAQKLSERDPRIVAILNPKNMGAYFCRNIGILNAKTEFIAFLDSDDIQAPDRLIRQITPLIEDSFLKATYCSARRWDLNFSNPIREIGLGFISVVFRQSLTDEVGFLDSVRFAGDSEFRERLWEWFSKYAVLDLEAELYKLRYRPDSLTSAGVGAILSKGNNGSLVFTNSSARDVYQTNFRTWHQKASSLYMPFPLVERPFDVGHPEQAVSL